MRRIIRDDRGATAIEFGLLLPLLMMILLGTIDYGHVFTVKLTMTNAAREGARVGITLPAAQARNGAIAAASRYLDDAGIAGYSVDANNPSDADPEIRIVISLEPFTPLIGFVPTPENLYAASTMRWELAPIPLAVTP